MPPRLAAPGSTALAQSIENASPGAIGARARRAQVARSKLGRSMLGLALVAPAFLSVILFIVGPALLSVGGTLFPEGAADGASLASYRAFFADPQSVGNLRFTVAVTAFALLSVLAVGFVIALYLRFSHTRLVVAIQVLALFPLFVPAIITAFALIRFLGPTGWLPSLLKALGIGFYQTPYLHASGAVIGLVWQEMPLTVMLLTAGLAQVSSRAIDAARDVGAGTLTLFLHIILPQMLRSVVVACSIGFLDIFGSFTVPYILGPAAPQMMSIYMQRTFTELHRAGTAETQAAVTFMVCLVVGALYTAFVFRDSAESGALVR
jgi:ABC-type spermidine/putrescine transport system permease subunit I